MGDSTVTARVVRPTAFKPDQSGNPRGRLPGTPNHVPVEARDVASRLVDDRAYRAELLKRMTDGTADALEPLMVLREGQAGGAPGDGRSEGVRGNQ